MTTQETIKTIQQVWINHRQKIKQAQLVHTCAPADLGKKGK